jgi:tetratricopeptide (TPR) repeat protein
VRVHQNTKAFLIRYNLGVACSSASQHVAAIEQFKIAKRLMDEQNVTDGIIHNSLGWAYLQSGDYPNAIQQFRLARAPALYAKLSEITKRQVDNSLAMAESHLRTSSPLRAAR